jgi:hypothetical protein
MPADFDFIVADARIDLKNWDKAIAQMEADARGIEKDFEQHTPKVTAQVDVKVDDQKIKRVDSDLQALKSGVTVDVDASTTDAKTKLDDLAGKLDDLKKLQKLQLILEIPNIIGNIGEVVQNAPIISNLVEMDTVLAQIEGRTGEMIPGAEHLIQDLYVNAWGESVTEIGNVITAAKNLGVTNENLKTAVTKAFELEALGIGDADEALRTMDTMIKNELVPDYEAAADVIVTGFQNGANRGQDLLDTFNEYGSTFAVMGITGASALAFINSGLAAGIDNSDRIADALRETNIRLSEMGTDENIKAAFDELDALSSIDLSNMWEGFQSGDIDGGEFYTAFFQALEDAAAADPAAAKTIAATLVGTIAEDFGIEAVSQLSGEWDPVWGAIEDRSIKAATKVNDTLGTAITELTRTIETDLVNSLNEALDLDGLVDKAKLAIQRLAAALREGKGFGEALEIALEMPGLADKISQLESTLGNFIIDFMSGIASIGEALGQDMSGLRDTVAGFGTGQLAFDIQTAQTEEEITAVISRAISRGVSSADVSSAIQTGFGEVMSAGDIGKAQALLASLEGLRDAPLGEYATGVVEAAGDDVDIAVEQLRKVKESIQADIILSASLPGQTKIREIDEAIGQLESRFANVDTTTMQTGIDMMAADLSRGLTEAVESGDFAGASVIAKQLLDANNPDVQALLSQFTTDLMFAFDDAIAAGDTEQAQSILDFMGLSEEANTTVFNAMQQQLLDFRDEGTYTAEEVKTAFSDMGTEVESATKQGGEGVNDLYDSIVSDKGVLGVTRLNSLAKRFDAVADSIKGALDEIRNAENKVGEGAIEGAAVGGLHGPGATLVGETGRELLFSDERFAVLNNQTTERLFTALSGIMGGSSTVNNTRNVNYSPTIVVQNDAQAALFGSSMMNQLRGEAF